MNQKTIIFYITAFLLLFTSGKAKAQCPTGDIFFYSQAQVNSFATNYPNCTEITGNLTISGSNITDLSPLSKLTKIGGYLTFYNNPLLTNLNGLSNLTEIGGYFYIDYHSQLTNLDGLSKLTEIGGYLDIRNNSQLTNIDGLSNLTEIDGNLIIHFNSLLANLEGLINLTKIGGYLHIGNNSQLTNLDALSNVTQIGGYLQISDNSKLTDISGLENIDAASITQLEIKNNPLLSVCNLGNICAFLATSKPRQISGNAGNCASASTVCLPQCPTGNVTFTTQAQVNAFATNYPNCTEITGNLTISGSNITDLSPLSKLTKIGGYLQIYTNPQLTNLDGLSNVTEIGGYLAINTNSKLTNLDGLSNLTEIGGDLYILQNNALTNLDGLSKLTKIGENLSISNNSLLTNLDGLSNLTEIGGFLEIFNNSKLADISGMENIDAASITNLHIVNNPLVSFCNLGNFCTYLANPANTHPRTISGNAGTCASASTVCLPQCPTGSLTFTTQAQVNAFATSYPNCTEITGNLTISGSNITDLSPLSKLTKIGGYLNIQSNSQLTNLDALGNLTEIGGYLDIRSNSQLTNLDGLSNLTQIGGYLRIQQNNALQNLDGLSNLTEIGGYLYIGSNSQLTDISGVENIDPASITNLYIQNNPLLTFCNLSNFCTYLANPANTHPRTIYGNSGNCANISTVCLPQCPTGDVGLYSQTAVNNFATNYPNCTEITGYLAIQGSDITDLSPLSNLTQIGGYLAIQGSDITDLSPLSNLTQIGGYLDIRNNSQLTNLDGLSNLTQIGGYVRIGLNSQLTNLDGLSNLTQIGGYLQISDNSQLTDISGVENIDPASITALYIQSNPLLTFCNLSNFCTYLANPANTHPRTISGNAGTCANLQAVIDACNATLSSTDTGRKEMLLYPNPVKEILYFSEEVSNIFITDISGRMVKQVSTKGKSVNVANLPNGTYLLTAITKEGKTITRKIIKE